MSVKEAMKHITSENSSIPERTILFIIDGMPAGIEQRIDLPSISALKKEGVFYKEVHLPLPVHPDFSSSYPWTCSLPNPVLMSGTIFIGQQGVTQNFIQHSFTKRPSAFFVNSWTYSAISEGFTYYKDYSEGSREMLFKDELPIEGAKDAMLKDNPEFIRIHCQGPGSAGHRSHREGGQTFTGNIWSSNSPFVQQNQYVDKLLGNFVDWLKSNGFWEKTVLIVMGDHGQSDSGGHPPYEKASATTSMIVTGKDIRKGVELEYAEVIDVAPTIAWLHKVSIPKFSNGRILEEIRNVESASFKYEFLMKQLNSALLQHHQLISKEAIRDFYPIEKIADWHKTPAGNSYQCFVERQIKILNQK